ncbi:uncharacterized protein TERG_12304 [Trichophyton rubrum CBS 118892]|uniref:Uncharacterized protein n=1 Tax=Trichophyton rubrum (strain ATCC MYA-4607 / CBS 118892) TaxID=559305 RepID=A0A080WV39_TRIRC|nr:uncharacterized protein TERG_12304 [Trichophyton rubrum CBS 118892]KFL61993.1 hypothetical protein TERG_12304 [Trichophyton rubrum CBS 118892]
MAGRAERSKPMYGIEPFSQSYATPKQSTDSVDDEESDDESGDEGNNTGFLHENDNVRHAVIKKAWHHTFRVGAVSIFSYLVLLEGFSTSLSRTQVRCKFRSSGKFIWTMSTPFLKPHIHRPYKLVLSMLLAI